MTFATRLLPPTADMKLLPHFAIVLTVGTYSAFALWLGLDPQALLKAFKIENATAGMLTEIRAFYGGIELGIAAAMVWLWIRGDRVASLVIGGLPLAAAASVRVIGMLVDEVSSLHIMIAIAEGSGGALCLFASRWARQESSLAKSSD